MLISYFFWIMIQGIEKICLERSVIKMLRITLMSYIFFHCVEESSSDELSVNEPKEFCETETFSPSCAEDEVILIDHAAYGRMKSGGRCITNDYGVLGCRLDIRDLLDSSCSGRRSCELPVAGLVPERYQPCPKDFRGYLEVSYKCTKVIDVSNQYCKSPGPIEIRDQSSGYLASIVTKSTGCGSFDNPWWLTVQPGRRIRLTLFDFSRASRTTNKQHHTSTCHVLAVIKEESTQTTQTVCSTLLRESEVFVSTTNVVEVRLGGTNKVMTGVHKTPDSYFLLHFQAFGCPDPMTPRYGSVQRLADTAIISCNETTTFGQSSSSAAKWHLTCENDEWKGHLGNCTTAAMVSSIISWQFFEKSQGVSIFLILSIAFLVGVCMVVIGSLYLRRQRLRREVELRRQADRLASDYQYRLKGALGPDMDPASGRRPGRPVDLLQNNSTELESFTQAENDYYRTWGRPSRYQHGAGGSYCPQPPNSLPPAPRFVPSDYPPTPYSDLKINPGGLEAGMLPGPPQAAAGYQHFVEHVYESPKFDRRDVV